MKQDVAICGDGPAASFAASAAVVVQPLVDSAHRVEEALGLLQRRVPRIVPPCWLPQVDCTGEIAPHGAQSERAVKRQLAC